MHGAMSVIKLFSCLHINGSLHHVHPTVTQEMRNIIVVVVVIVVIIIIFLQTCELHQTKPLRTKKKAEKPVFMCNTKVEVCCNGIFGI
jgi:hypothetical protein